MYIIIVGNSCSMMMIEEATLVLQSLGNGWHTHSCWTCHQYTLAQN